MGITKMLVESLWGFPCYGGVVIVEISRYGGMIVGNFPYLAESVFLIWFPLVYLRSYKMKVNDGYLLTYF